MWASAWILVHGLVIPTVLGRPGLGARAGLCELHRAFGQRLAPRRWELLEPHRRRDRGRIRLLQRQLQPQLVVRQRHPQAAHRPAPVLRLQRDPWASQGHVVNGWQGNELDNNTGKTYGLSVHFAPVQRLAFFAHYLGGPEQASDNEPLAPPLRRGRRGARQALHADASKRLLGREAYVREARTKSGPGRWRTCAGTPVSASPCPCVANILTIATGFPPLLHAGQALGAHPDPDLENSSTTPYCGSKRATTVPSEVRYLPSVRVRAL